MIDAEMIEKLSQKHIGRYGRLIKAASKGSRNIRVDECHHYLKIWTSIQKKGEWDKLDKTERMELQDALEDEEGMAARRRRGKWSAY